MAGRQFDLQSSHVIPALIKKCLEAIKQGRKEVLFGERTARREFLYVEDAARAVVLAAIKYNKPSRWTSQQ